MFKMLPLYPLAGNLIPCLTRAETGTQNFKVGVGFKASLPPPLERARCRDIGLPSTWSITTRETDSTHISQLKTPHLDKLIESKWARGQGAARGWTESWQGAERKELR